MAEPGSPRERPPGSWRPLVRVYASVALFAAGANALHVLVPAYLADGLGLETAAIGATAAVFATAALLSRLPVGAAYRFDRATPLLVLGGLLSTTAFLLVPTVRGAVPFAGLMALDGFGWAIVTTTQLTLLVASRPAGMSTAAAMAWLAGSAGVGHTIGGVSGGVLADTFGYHAAFVVLAFVPALATVAMVVTTRHAGSQIVAAPRASVPARAGLRDIGRAVRSLPPIVWAAVVVMIYINFVNGLVNTFHPALALAAGLSLTEIGTLATCRAFGSSTVRLAAGPVFLRRPVPARVTTPLIVLAAVAVVLIPSLRSSFLWQVPLFLAIGVSRGLLRVTGSAQAFDGIGDDEQVQGLTSAMLHMGLDSGKIAGPLLAGLAAQATSLGTMFRVLPVLLVAGYATLALASHRGDTERRAGSSQPPDPAATRSNWSDLDEDVDAYE